MPNEDLQVPTLLVGVGGLGSRVVEEVYGRIPVDERGRVAMHVLDTNINDLTKLKFLRDKDERTQLGAPRLVAEYLLHYPEVRDWFPSDPILNGKSTIAGAGQVRAVSRLSFMHLLNRAADLAGLGSAVDKLFELRNSYGLRANPRVMIVNSLAGGTGAGAFLQVALYLRYIISQRMQTPGAVIVRGFFILPDILVNTRVLDKTEWERVRANAQACLKELDAMTRTRYDPEVKVSLEYRPGGKLEPISSIPFEYSFLFDHGNLQGQNLNSLEQYLHQVSRCVHLALFSPLSGEQFSQEDNQIMNLIESGGRAFYGSAATASLVYPKDDIIAYLASRWAAEDIDDLWLRPDNDYRRELETWRRDLERSIHRPEPVRGQHYRNYLTELYKSDDAPPYFKRVYPQAFELDSKGKPESSKAEYWLAEIEGFVKGSINIDMPPGLGLDSTKLRLQNHVRQTVANAESRIYEYWDVSKAYIPQHTSSLANQILTRDGEDDRLGKGTGKHRLNYWLFTETSPLHPLAIRYTLYDAHEQLEGRLRDLEERNRGTQRAIESYEEVYDLPATVTKIETATDRVRGALSQPAFQRLFRDQLKEFADIYEQESDAQYRRIGRYLEEKLLEEVLKRVLNGLESFIREWEAFFDSLQGLRADFLNERNRLLTLHETRNDPTVQYVLANSSAKDTLYSEMRSTLVGGGNEEEVHTVTFERLYRAFCRRQLRQDAGESVTKSFQRALLENLRAQIMRYDRLPEGVVAALLREADLKGQERGDYLTRRIGNLTGLAFPYIQVRDKPDKTERQLHFWGLHEGAKEALPDSAHTAIAGQAQYDTAFDPNEIVYYTVIYGYEARELGKFTPGLRTKDLLLPEGEYYRAYRQRIDAVRQGGISPHLDTRWHDTLPDFWVSTEDVDAAALRGIALRVLKPVNDVWQYGFDALSDSKRAGHFYHLRKTLERRDDILKVIDETLATQRERDQEAYPGEVTAHSFIRGMRDIEKLGVNLFDLVANSKEGAPELPLRDREERTARIFDTLCAEIATYVASCVGDKAQAARLTGKIIRDLAHDSLLLNSNDPQDAVLRERLRETVARYAPQV